MLQILQDSPVARCCDLGRTPGRECFDLRDKVVHLSKDMRGRWCAKQPAIDDAGARSREMIPIPTTPSWHPDCDIDAVKLFLLRKVLQSENNGYRLPA